MKNIYKIRILVFLLLISLGLSGLAQNEAIHNQGIMEYEFVNPAYHSFKDYISVSAYNRIQWAGKIEYSPKTYASNMYIPFIPGRLGGSLNVMVEDLGLRRMTDVKLGFCHNIQLFAGKHLSVGYSAGIIQDTYMMDRLRYYPDEEVSFLATDYTYASVAVGFFYWSDRTYLSLSSIASHLKGNMVSSDYLPGLDFSAGHLFLLSPFVKMMPTFSIKYLNWDAMNKANYKNSLPTIYDLGVNVQLGTRVWIGTSCRPKYAQTFTCDLRFSKHIRMGYTYEMGIGSGLNQFDSHNVKMTISLSPLKLKRSSSLATTDEEPASDDETTGLKPITGEPAVMSFFR